MNRGLDRPEITPRTSNCAKAQPAGDRLGGLFMAALLSVIGAAGDALGEWPTQRGDLRRSGVSEESIDPARLVPAWTWESAVPIRSAWPAPAKWDAYAALAGLKSMRNYDPVLHVTAVQDEAGDAIFIGGPTDDSVRRLDARTGGELWRFSADGPVRIAPTWHDNVLYFGSDDGYAYAIDARTGRLKWRTPAVPDARLILNNGRLVSPWPIRTGVHVADGTAYFAASFLPWESTYICAVDAATGEPEGPGRYIRDVGSGWTMEGPLLLSANSVIVPQGRVAPIVLDRATGEPRGALSGGGGSFVLLTEDADVLHGPGNKAGWITDTDGASREQIASYQRGNAMIVEGSTAWMLADEILTALDRPSRTLLWSVRTRTPLELIKGGDVLYAGGDGIVAAYDARDGTLLWEAPVTGNAYGLALSNGRLLVSTDEGRIHAFHPEGEGGARPEGVQPLAADHVQQLPTLAPIEDPALVDRWVFREDLIEHVPLTEGDPRRYPIVANQVPGRPPGRFRAFNEYVETPIGRFVLLDGASNELQAANPGEEPALPQSNLTAVAVARIDAPRTWGGLVGAMQDNGENEAGWILGFRGLKPGLGVRSSETNPSMSWTVAPNDIVPGSWHVIAATYDGEQMVLYLDGEAVATSAAEAGDLVYPEKYWYPLGAYHDDDEYFVTQGALAEMRVYDRALSPEEIAEITPDWQPLLELTAEVPAPAADPGGMPAAGPIFAFEAPGRARARWRTEEPLTTHARWSIDGEEVGSFTGSEPTREHEIVIDGLRRNRIHEVRVALEDDPESELSRAFQLDTSFDYTREGVDAGRDHPVAMNALEKSGIDRGLAVVVGGRTPEIALTLARRSALNVIVFDHDSQTIERLRTRLLDEGVYGERISAFELNDLAKAPLPPQCVNLLISIGVNPISRAAAERLLTPATGVAFNARGMVQAPPTPGAGVWTHMYGTPDNSGYGGETLGGIRTNERLALQWIGRPGPRYQSDRGNRKPAPLAVSGRLYMQGLNRIIAVDGSNGTILWALELPEMQRFNIPRDTSNWCADESRIYVAGPRLLVIDGATGEILRTQDVPELERDRADYEWGYVARTGKLLVGSAVREGSTHTGWWGSEHWYDGKDNFSILKVCSDALFATDPDSGSVRWRYQPEALILNATITAADGKLVFLEARDEELYDEDSRKIEDPRIWTQLDMVALDEETGQELWRRQAQPMPGRIAVYTAVSDGILYLQTSDEGAFALYAFDLESGRSLWRRKFDWETDHHGKHLSRIAVAEGTLYLRPYVLDAHTGEVLRTAFPEGHQCGNYACTRDSLFLRAGDLTMWSPHEDAVSKWTRLRPDCWISSIPANGMLLSPEGGGGCSCGSWIESSMAFRPIIKGAPGNGLRVDAPAEGSE